MHLRCETCNATYDNPPTLDYATNQHNWSADHPASWEHVDD